MLVTSYDNYTASNPYSAFHDISQLLMLHHVMLMLCSVPNRLIYYALNSLEFLLIEQEDKEPVFDSVKTIIGMLEVSTEFADNITFNHERIRKALPAGHLDATTLADYLVKKVS